MNTLNFIDLKDNKQYNKMAKKLYRTAFPKEERAPFFFLKALARKDKAKFYGVCDGDAFVGLVYPIFYKDIVYVFYLAIEKELRGQGYGSKVLLAVKEKYAQKRIILMAEESTPNYSDYEERLRRKNFYYSNGFQELDYKVVELCVVYDMLGCDGNSSLVTCEEYRELIKNYWGEWLYQNVYVKISEMVAK